MKIAFFECKEEERTFFESHLEGHTLFFFEQPIQEVVTTSEPYEIVSVFVHSRINDDLLDKLPNLAYLQTRSTGYDHVKCPQLYARGMKVSNVVICRTGSSRIRIFSPAQCHTQDLYFTAKISRR